MRMERNMDTKTQRHAMFGHRTNMNMDTGWKRVGSESVRIIRSNTPPHSASEIDVCLDDVFMSNSTCTVIRRS